MPKASLYPAGNASTDFKLMGVDNAGNVKLFAKADLKTLFTSTSPGGPPPDTVAPTITSPNVFTQPENSPFAVTLTANEQVTWAKVGGADQALFTLNGATLALTAKDYEIPVDADGNNSYIVQVRATDTAGNVTNQTITVNVTDVADTIVDSTPPTLTSGSAFSLPENTAFSLTLTADEQVTWSKVGGADAGLFSLVGPVLSLTAKDYETPTDADANNSYIVQVRATDTSGNVSAVQTITVTVSDVADGDMTAPIITSGNAFSQPENGAFSTVLTANEQVTWAKVGGADQALFTLTGNVLALSARDFESPTDADANNTYVVQVRATDTSGNASAIQTITLTVTDVSEGPAPTVVPQPVSPPVISGATINGSPVTSQPAVWSEAATPVPGNTVAPSLSPSNPRVGDTVTVDVGTWTNSPTVYNKQITRDGVDISGATNLTYVVQAGDLGKALRVRVVAVGAGGSSQPVTSLPTSAVTAAVAEGEDFTWTGERYSGGGHEADSFPGDGPTIVAIGQACALTGTGIINDIYFELKNNSGNSSGSGSFFGFQEYPAVNDNPNVFFYTSLGFSWYIGSGNINLKDSRFDGSVDGNVPFPTPGNVARICFKPTTRKLWIANETGDWNGDPTANPATGAGGFTLDANTNPFFLKMTNDGSFADTDSLTIKARASTWKYSAPSGFTANRA